MKRVHPTMWQHTKIDGPREGPWLDRRPGKRGRTFSQWRAVGWNYQRVMPFDMWADIGCPEPAPRVFGHTIQMQRDIDRGLYF